MEYKFTPQRFLLASSYSFKAWRGIIYYLLLGFFLLLTTWFLPTLIGVANAQQAVLVRAWEQKSGAQISFDWPKPVSYNATLDDNRLNITFSEPLVANLAPVLRLAPSYISGGTLSQDGKQVLLTLKRSVTLTTYHKDNRIIIEVRPNNQSDRSVIVDGAGNTTAMVKPEIGIDNSNNLVINQDNRPKLDQEVPAVPPAQAPQNQANLIPPTTQPEVQPSDNKIPEVDISVQFKPDGTMVLAYIWPDRISYNFTNEQGNLDLRFSKVGNIDRKKLTTLLPEWLKTPILTNLDTGTSVMMNITEPYTVINKLAGNSVVLEFYPPGVLVSNPEAVTQGADGKPAPSQDEIQTARAVIAGTLVSKAMPIEKALAVLAAIGEIDEKGLKPDTADTPRAQDIIGPTLVNLRFDWPNEVGGAIFRRGEYIWIVFDQKSPIDIEPLRGENQDVVVDFEQLPIKNSTVIRLLVPDMKINPSLRKENNTWLVDLRVGETQPAKNVGIDINITSDLGAHIFFPSLEPGEYLNVIDPAVGDAVNIITFREPGVGVLGQREYPDFSILPSAQGIAMIAKSDNLAFAKAEDGFTVTAENGLYVSGVSPKTEIDSFIGFKTETLFDFKEWAKGTPQEFLKNRQALMRTITEMPKEDLARARLHLARFYVANDLGPEAISIINIIETDHPKLMETNGLIALRGAANLIAGRLEEASNDLNDKRLDGFREASLWRGALLAKQGKMKDATPLFRLSASQIRNYPESLKGSLGILMIESAMENRDLQLATSIIEQLDQVKADLPRGTAGDLLYHKARLMASRTDFELAYDYWDQLIKSKDRKNSARSLLAYINTGLKQDLISKDEALERLESLRYQWRGDQFELAVLEQLGQMYIQNERYAEGFSVYRTALSYFPNDPAAKVISNRMHEIFRDLFLFGKADQMEAATALAFYDSYREFTPSGEDGNIMIEKLADRLIRVDLLDRAARLLEYQIEHRLAGTKRVQTGAKLGLVRLLENKPELTLAALDSTEDISQTGELADDRRRLRAQAHFALNNPDEAIKLLAGDISRDANILRRDIYWKNKRWGEVAKNLQRLAGKPPDRSRQAMPEDRAKNVVDWAVALKLDQDQRGLSFLREVYGNAMSKTEMADVFNYLTLGNSQLTDLNKKSEIEAYVQELTGKSAFDDFMKSYREKLF